MEDELDGSPVSTPGNFSSCEGSDIERYGSANSYLGTASACSSLGSRSEFFDTFRSLRAGSESGSFCSRESGVSDESRFEDAADFDVTGYSSDGSTDLARGEHGLLEDRILRGRLDALPRIRTRRNPSLSTRSSRGVRGKAVTPNMDKLKDTVLANEGSVTTRTNGAGEPGFSVCALVSGNGAASELVNKTVSTQDYSRKINDGAHSPSAIGNSARFVLKGHPEEVEKDTETVKTKPSSDSVKMEDGVVQVRGTVLVHHSEGAAETDSDNFEDCGSVMKLQLISSSQPNQSLEDASQKRPIFCHQSRASRMPITDNTYAINEFETDEGSFSKLHKDIITQHPENGNIVSKACAKDDDEGLKPEKEGYVDVLVDMEEILVHSDKSHMSALGYSPRFRDASPSTSTSPDYYAYPLIKFPSKIDWIEVVDAKRKKGDVSFGERLIGGKEYGVYKLQIQAGKDKWVVERRYREFFALYCQLKALFRFHGLPLPSPWSKVEQDSRKVFGSASQNVINERSTLIQDCLRSIIHCKTPFGTPSSLVWFLSPSKDFVNSSLLNNVLPDALQRVRDDHRFISIYSEANNASTNSLSLVVDNKPSKSMRQLLVEQHYACAGCHRHLDYGKTLLQEFMQTIGWGRPRVCEYTGKVFCSSCHTNDTTILPARVLHHWDFSFFPVSKQAKIYLESIYCQPLLCISAVNPFLFSKVSSLHQVVDRRSKIRAMLPHISCQFQKAVHRELGPRRYLLDTTDFFALRDLVDLSKGAFAVLPVILDTIWSKILDHIKRQCYMCYELGVPCAAHESCKAPSALIYPLQEPESVRCTSCGLIFHNSCTQRPFVCQCGKVDMMKLTVGPPSLWDRDNEIELEGVVDSPSSKSTLKSSAVGYIFELLSKARPDVEWKPADSSRSIIMMDSLPNSIL